MNNKQVHDTGLAIRREVLGTAYVDAALKSADDFSRPFQEFITEYCWGAIWGRPGLPKKLRSIVNIAMLTALNRQAELKIHLRGALKNGCTKDELMEVLLQTAVYCGVPAAVEAFRTAREAFKDEAG